MAPKRKDTPTEIETAVLTKSRRRCALCYHLEGDLTEKHGQIAHLDQNPSNYVEDNLAFFCTRHHSLYDSRTSQHKDYTMAEAKEARAALYEVIAAGKHTPPHVPPGMQVGEESVVYGNVPPNSSIGPKSVVVGATDAHGNTVIPGGFAIGHGAYADPGSVSIGYSAGGGGRPRTAPGNC